MMTMIMVMTNKHAGDCADKKVLNDLLVIRICRKLISLSCFFESAMNDWGGPGADTWSGQTGSSCLCIARKNVGHLSREAFSDKNLALMRCVSEC